MGNACARKKRACWPSCDASPRAGRAMALNMGEGGIAQSRRRAPHVGGIPFDLYIYRQKSLMGNACVRKKRACWPSCDVSPRAGRAMAPSMGEGGLPKAAAARTALKTSIPALDGKQFIPRAVAEKHAQRRWLPNRRKARASALHACTRTLRFCRQRRSRENSSETARASTASAGETGMKKPPENCRSPEV